MKVNWDAIDITISILVAIRFLVLIPLIVYGLFLFNKYKKHDIMRYRNHILIYIMSILIIIGIGGERTFMLSVTAWNIINVDIWIVYFMFSIFWWAIFALFAVKTYHLYYQQQYNIAIADMSWKKDINPYNVDWYIKHIKTWGNIVWLIKLCIIPYTISCATDALFPYLFGEGIAFDFFHFTLLAIPACVSYIVSYKAEKVRDIYGIRDEILYQSMINLFSLIIYLIVFLICEFQPDLSKIYANDLIRFEWTLYSVLCDFCAISFAIFPTLFPVYLIKKDEMEETLKTIRINDDIKVNGETMDMIIGNYEAFKLFMNHLVSEFCAENLLFLVELIQCKHEYQKRNNFKVKIPKTDSISMDKFMIIDFNLNPLNGQQYKTEQERYFTYLFHKNGSIKSKISIPIQIPKSLILTKHTHLFHQMLCLYNKYIDQLNIPYTVHQGLDNIFGNNANHNKMNQLSEEAVFNIMDECASEIIILLHTSFTRFASTKSFTSIINEIKNNDANISMKMKQVLQSNDTPIIVMEKTMSTTNT